jgi:magnesium-transporting ATPase (P-type)
MTKGGQPKMGSTAVRGEVEATVQFTGIHTFFGKTADLLNSEKGLDHLQRTLLLIVGILTVISIILCATCFIYIYARFARDPSCCCTRVSHTCKNTCSVTVLPLSLLRMRTTTPKGHSVAFGEFV